MDRETREKLACSLTARSVELVPFLPYLLQDLWTLGSSPAMMTRLIAGHFPPREGAKALDLACGKGAVSVAIAQKLGISVHGFDLTAEFIEYARGKAEALGVSALCHFTVGDVNDVVERENGYDIAIFGAAGNILGTPAQTLRKLARTVAPGGYILIDESYLPDGADGAGQIRYQNYEYLRRGQWLQLFQENGLRLVEEMMDDEPYDFDADNAAIAKRAAELSAKHPELHELFDGYVRSQLDECEDLENELISVTWMLQKA